MTGRSPQFRFWAWTSTVVLALLPGCGRRSAEPTWADPAAESDNGAAAVASEDPATSHPAGPDSTDPPPALPAVPETGGASGDAPPPSAAPLARQPFAGWGTPRLALLITGQQHGYIEPCGCTSLDNQKGGLARRHSLAKQLQARGWPVVGLDAGNQVRRFGRQAEIKFHMTLDGLKTIGYQAAVLGVDDLRLSVDELVAATVPPEGQTTPFVCANAAVLDWSLMPDHKIIEQGGRKIGVTAIVGAEWRDEVARDDVVYKDPTEGLQAVLPKLQAASCDVLVLLAHASVSEAKKLARAFPQFDVVVAAGAISDGTDPLYQPERIDGTETMFVQTGIKGMFAVVIGVFDDATTPLRYQRIPLDNTYEDSPDMLNLLKSYQNQLQTLGLDGLGLRPVAHPSGNQFTGSEKCGECHSKAYAVWESTPHASATDSLVNPVERAEIQRHFDPECLSCHVTGWHPQRFFPYTSGYLELSAAATAGLHGNGCENCHGPGSAHVNAEEGGTTDETKLQMLRKAMRLPKSAAEKKCIECHDIDNSPAFHEPGAFEHYWEQVEHKGLD